MNVSTNCLTVDYISQQREYMTDCGQFFSIKIQIVCRAANKMNFGGKCMKEYDAVIVGGRAAGILPHWSLSGKTGKQNRDSGKRAAD